MSERDDYLEIVNDVIMSSLSAQAEQEAFIAEFDARQDTDVAVLIELLKEMDVDPNIFAHQLWDTAPLRLYENAPNPARKLLKHELGTIVAFMDMQDITNNSLADEKYKTAFAAIRLYGEQLSLPLRHLLDVVSPDLPLVSSLEAIDLTIYDSLMKQTWEKQEREAKINRAVRMKVNDELNAVFGHHDDSMHVASFAAALIIAAARQYDDSNLRPLDATYLYGVASKLYGDSYTTKYHIDAIWRTCLAYVQSQME